MRHKKYKRRTTPCDHGYWPCCSRPRPERLDGEPIRNVSQPTLTVYPASLDRTARTAVIIGPGGGYEFLPFAREGDQYAQCLAGQGTASNRPQRAEEWLRDRKLVP
ncbi:hypothetical protein [Duganella violaceipulchra]|uniref:Uncharacterized protein n=1 Tax=Duganella violaceipulchra TaxID=2849652 RepID=A0AA41H308_9BURK|nr:hypothetical protein [Duganella violaceicalia]MBV6319518.1 hypothetical protein [Duganella violaceicalia]MCP2006670.1 hypothetical protein [Duganella violaceicalia]